MCGSFTCSKNSLIALNILYVLVAILLIGVAGAAKYTTIVSSLAIVSGIIACGVFLLMIALVGLCAASRHHQVMLFFYMIVLFVIFVIQFGVACACLAINEEQQENALVQGWKSSTPALKSEAQIVYHCCGFDSPSPNGTTAPDHPSCMRVMNDSGEPCCPNADESTCCIPPNECKCDLCKPRLLKAVQKGFNAVGGVGLFFSFTEFVGVWLTVRYRNQRDPVANPSAFL